MSLNGTLEAFPLTEVLRLLARSQKTGCLSIEASGMHGKLFLEEGLLSYATTRREEDLRTDLLNAGFITEPDWLLVERRERGLSQVLSEGVTAEDLTQFITEQITDVVFRLRRPGMGAFDFADDIRPRYDTDQRIDVEVCIDEAERRIAEWKEIEEVIPGLNFRLQMAYELPGEREVTITPDTWRLLAALRGQATVVDLADRLQATDFQVAQAMAALVRAKLVEVIDEVPGARYSYGSEDDDFGIVGAGERLRSHQPVQQEEPAEEPEDEAEFLHAVISDMMGEGSDSKSSELLDDEEEDEEEEENTEAEFAENVQALRRRRGLGALARELSELNE